MTRRVVRVLALLTLSLLATAAGAQAALKAGTFDPPRDAPAFELPGSDGSTVSPARFRGKVVLLGFGFTSCPDVCPITLATLTQAYRRLGAAAKDVQVLYVTVDPDRDDAARLAGYLGGFEPSFLGATGTAAQLEAVRREYGVAAQKIETPEGYRYGHSSFVYLIDRDGKLRALMPYGRPADDYVHDVGVLLGGP